MSYRGGAAPAAAWVVGMFCLAGVGVSVLSLAEEFVNDNGNGDGRGIDTGLRVGRDVRRALPFCCASTAVILQDSALPHGASSRH